VEVLIHPQRPQQSCRPTVVLPRASPRAPAESSFVISCNRKSNALSVPLAPAKSLVEQGALLAGYLPLRCIHTHCAHPTLQDTQSTLFQTIIGASVLFGENSPLRKCSSPPHPASSSLSTIGALYRFFFWDARRNYVFFNSFFKRESTCSSLLYRLILGTHINPLTSITYKKTGPSAAF
jgi:hypothetical protein